MLRALQRKRRQRSVVGARPPAWPRVPSERIRKMIKKIGEEMMGEPELAQVIMMPLKAKLYAIQPGTKIFRCKVQTPPGRQFEIRTEAYRRIEKALDGRPAILDFALGKGHVVAYNFSPIHRDMNRSDHRFLWNAILNWNALTPPGV